MPFDRGYFMAESGNACRWLAIRRGDKLGVDIDWKREPSLAEQDEFNWFFKERCRELPGIEFALQSALVDNPKEVITRFLETGDPGVKTRPIE
jgi:hypothetical protein